jgi:hypothetical protein
MGCCSTQESGVENMWDDVAGNIGQALRDGHAVLYGVPRAAQGRAVQADPIKPTLKAPAINRFETKL